MTPGTGALLAGRFLVLGVGQRCRDRRLIPAIDEVARQPVTVHWPTSLEGATAVRAEGALAPRVAGRGVRAPSGVWQEHATFFGVGPRREPESPLPLLGAARSGVGAVPVERALMWLADVSRGLDRVHRAGIVHGAVVPDRVTVVGERAYLRLAIAPSGQICGAGLAAPEVVDGRPADRASDLYGLGLILVAAIGEHAFRGDTPWALRRQQKRVWRAQGRVPRGVRQLVRALLHPEPGRRPRTAGGVAVLADRLRRHPGRALPRLHPAPWRLWDPVQVLASDPAENRWVAVGGATGRAEARRRADALVLRGWAVRRVRVAVAGSDWIWVGLAVVVAGMAVPVVGALVAAAAGVRIARVGVVADVTRGVPEVLPPAMTPVAPGRWTVMALGGALIWCAVLMRFWPAAAWAPLGIAAAAVVVLWGPRRRALHDVVREQRVRVAVGDTQATLAKGAAPLDAALLLAGTADRLAPEVEGHAERAEEVAEAARALVAAGDESPISLEALRRSRAEWSES